MSSEPNTDILEIDPNQFGKALAANTAFGAIDAMLGGILILTANSLTSPYTIPYQTADEPTGTKTALRFFKLNVTGALSAAWSAYLPAGKQKFFVAQNNTTGGQTITVLVSGQTGVKVPPGTEAFCFLNGTDVELLAITSGPPALVISSKTANYTVLANDIGKRFDNQGASAQVNFTLPAAVAGLNFAFTVHAAQTIQVIANGTDKIALGETNSAAGGNLVSITPFSFIELEAHSSGQWVICRATGIWTVN